jgi:peptidoglycan-associated lipoprotein
MRHRELIAVVALCATISSLGCAGRPRQGARVEPAPPALVEEPSPRPPAAPEPEPTPTPAAAATEDDAFARITLEELNAARPLGDVFFDLDHFLVGKDARAVLQRNAEWMLRWTSTRITIEGHADERSTSEYNLALGEQRANAAREYLVSLGVPRDRIVVVSKGEEAPFCTESHEGCWQQNRRGHFIVAAK